jgi:hypothetical protein
LAEVTLTAGDDRFDNDAVPFSHTRDATSNFQDFSRQFMTDRDRERSGRVLSLENVKVTSADGGGFHADQDLFWRKPGESFLLKLHFPRSADHRHRVGLNHLCFKYL